MGLFEAYMNLDHMYWVGVMEMFLDVVIWSYFIYRLYMEATGKHITLRPPTTLISDFGEKIHVIFVDGDRHVLFYTKQSKMKLVTYDEFMLLSKG